MDKASKAFGLRGTDATSAMNKRVRLLSSRAREGSGTPPLPSSSRGGAHVDLLWYAKQSYGISRQRIYQILDEEIDDAAGKLRAAEDELLAAQDELMYRRRVLTLRPHAYQSQKDRS